MTNSHTHKHTHFTLQLTCMHSSRTHPFHQFMINSLLLKIFSLLNLHNLNNYVSAWERFTLIYCMPNDQPVNLQENSLTETVSSTPQQLVFSVDFVILTGRNLCSCVDQQLSLFVCLHLCHHVFLWK